MTGRSALCTIEDLVDVIVDLSEWVLVEWPEMDFEWSSEHSLQLELVIVWFLNVSVYVLYHFKFWAQ